MTAHTAAAAAIVMTSMIGCASAEPTSKMAAAADPPLPDTRIYTGSVVEASIAPDGEHSEWFWRRGFPAAYLWMFADSAGE